MKRTLEYKFPLLVSFASTLACSAMGQAQVPAGPPDVFVSPVPSITPPPLGDVVIPPFSVTSPGVNRFVEEQKARLAIVSNLPADASVQWFKNGEVLVGETGLAIEINGANSANAGMYSVVVTHESNVVASASILFSVTSLADADKDFFLWLSRFFNVDQLNNLDLSGDSADPDKDGIKNLFEYAMGLNPIEWNVPPKFELKQVNRIPAKLQFSRATGRDDLIYVYEGSSSLENWIQLDLASSNVEPNGDVSEIVAVEFDWLIEPSFPRFVRVGIERVEGE